jgi:cyclophilin family peptidyl-prolyl cis-trans isomerase
VKLLPEIAPQSVNSFAFLAREGFYDGCTFHRVIPGFVAQGGDPTGTGSGGPGYRIPDELSDRPFVAGTLGVANAGPNTNGSQFFIVLAPAPHLTGRYTLFAEVESGMDVALALTPRDPQSAAGPGDVITSIEIVEA